MNRLRNIKRSARRALHCEMSVPARYYAVPSATGVDCTVRVHTEFGLLGSLTGSQGFGERTEAEPHLIFLVSEVPAPRVNSVVAVEPGEAYRITAADPADDITIKATVVRLPAGDPLLTTLAFPS